MREIWLRAWDKKLSVMWEPIELKKLLKYLWFEQFPNADAYTEIKKHFMEGIIPSGRKITLNFAIAGYEILPDVLLKYFDPDFYLIKLTPMHKTVTAENHFLRTPINHPYRWHEPDLKHAGYDVLVFVASREEDLGRITCGNAILSGSTPEVDFTEV